MELGISENELIDLDLMYVTFTYDHESMFLSIFIHTKIISGIKDEQVMYDPEWWGGMLLVAAKLRGFTRGGEERVR